MALQAVGLQTYIWNNNLKSLALLAGFPLLLLAIAYALVLMFVAAETGGLQDGLAEAARVMPVAAPITLGAAAAWFAVAYVSHQAIIDLAVGSRGVTRTEEPDLYNLLENLCISRGESVPRLRIVETGARNAFASGLSPNRAVITVTRGLLDALEKDELEAVLAHELSHVRNYDVRLLVIAVVFVGIISFVGEMFFRGLLRVNLARSTGRARRSGGGNAGVLVLLAFVIIAVSYALAILIRYALSRRREYLADAGAVELTKNPDAMISALEKISGRSSLDRAPQEMREMFIDNAAAGFASLFATHPPIEARIKAIRDYAGGSATV